MTNSSDKYLTQEQQAEKGRIGNLNGKWAVAFKLTILFAGITLPALLGLATWVVASIQEIRIVQAETAVEVRALVSAGPRYSAIEAKADRLSDREWTLHYIKENYPPQWLRDSLTLHAKEIDAIHKAIERITNRLENINSQLP